MKLYMLTRGSYSDYRVFGIFSSRENAELYQRHVDKLDPVPYSEWNDIEEMQLDAGIAPLQAGLSYYCVCIHKLTGNIVSVDTADDTDISNYDREHEFGNLHFYMGARNEEHAVKIAADRRRQILAGVPIDQIADDTETPEPKRQRYIRAAREE